MKHVTISLSDAHQAFVEEEVAAGKYADAEACVTALIHAVAKEWAQEKLETLLMEGVNSPSAPWTSESMDEIRRAARARL